jgi:hypothetical protein
MDYTITIGVSDHRGLLGREEGQLELFFFRNLEKCQRRKCCRLSV